MSVKITFDIPKSLDAIKLKDYQKYMKVVEANKEEGDSELINLKALEYFCGLTLKEAYNLKMTHFNFVLSHLSEVFKEDTPLVPKFDMVDPNGNKLTFGFIPKLDDISMGEFVDLDTYLGDWENMHRAMAVLYRPVTTDINNKYLIEPYENSSKYCTVMEDMPVNVAIGAMVFFYRLGNVLSTHILDSLQKELQNGAISQLRQTLEKSGVGISQFTQSLREMRQNLKKLRHFH